MSAKPETLPSILCVDDEPRIVEGLALHLRKDYRVLTAHGGQSALQLLKQQGAPAVVVSDMRMPGMDGAVLLKHIKNLYPDTTRILLTGEPGRDAAIAAVNEGQIFRFLTKPCPPDQLRAAIDAAVGHHRLLSAERILLQETLIGCIRALVDILALTHAVAFGRTTRVTRLATDLASAMGMTGFWQLEAAAMLSQIGYIALPNELVEKLYYGKRLSAEERTLVDAAPQVAQKLLKHIPRLDPVIAILSASRALNADPSESLVKSGAQVLRLVFEYDAHCALLETLEGLVGVGLQAEEIAEVAVGRVTVGMVFQDDLRTAVGAVLIPKGFEVTEAFLERLRNFGPAIVQEKVRVATPVRRRA
jgi:response regulator RpfG family c-di-GMP phosphodiesterase